MITNANAIFQFMHCARCLQEKPIDISPQDWARFSVGMTKIGLQVWCNRHNMNVIHIDFQGHKHPANMKGKDDEGIQSAYIN